MLDTSCFACTFAGSLKPGVYLRAQAQGPPQLRLLQDCSRGSTAACAVCIANLVEGLMLSPDSQALGSSKLVAHLTAQAQGPPQLWLLQDCRCQGELLRARLQHSNLLPAGCWAAATIDAVWGQQARLHLNSHRHLTCRWARSSM